MLGEIYAQSFEAAGYDVKKQLNLGSEVIAFKSLKSGEIDAYPEYTGTVLTTLYKVPAEDVPEGARGGLPRDRGAGARGQDQGAAADAVREHLPPRSDQGDRPAARRKTTSQLAPKAKDLTITGYPECRQRLDCYVGLQRAYGMKFKDFVASEQTYEVLDQKEADIGFLFTTDANLATGKYQTFEDDKKFFPPYNVTLLMGDDAVKRVGPQALRTWSRRSRSH